MNDLTVVVPRLLAQGMMALREVAIMPLLVNRQYESMAGERGSTIDVPIPSAIAAQDVTPAATPPATADITPTMVSVPMDQWKEAPFFLTDKDVVQIMDGVIPMQASEAIKSLANVINVYILSLYKGFYGFVGTPGTTPLAANTVDATNVRKVLNKQMAPVDDRNIVLDPDAEGNALNLQAFQDTAWSGSPQAIIDGQLNRKLGFQWWMHQLIPTHTKGTAITITLTSNSAVGDGTVSLKGASGTLVKGDIITIAGDSQTYVVGGVGAPYTLSASATVVTIAPKLKVAVDGSSTPVVVTLKGSHVVNLAFHRDAIAFATKPFKNVEAGLGSVTSVAADPLSGLTLRLEVTREFKRTRYSFDVLYGGVVARPELGARLAG